MKQLAELKRFDGGYYELVKSFPCEVVKVASIGHYQGDTMYLLSDGQYWGILTHAYGSCSGCDEYEACYGYQDKLLELRERLFNDTKWFDTRAELLEYINSTEWELKIEYQLEGFAEFLSEVKNYLASGPLDKGYARITTWDDGSEFHVLVKTETSLAINLVVDERKLDGNERVTLECFVTSEDTLHYLQNKVNWGEWKHVVPIEAAIKAMENDVNQSIVIGVKWNKFMMLVPSHWHDPETGSFGGQFSFNPYRKEEQNG